MHIIRLFSPWQIASPLFVVLAAPAALAVEVSFVEGRIATYLNSTVLPTAVYSTTDHVPRVDQEKAPYVVSQSPSRGRVVHNNIEHWTGTTRGFASLIYDFRDDGSGSAVFKFSASAEVDFIPTPDPSDHPDYGDRSEAYTFAGNPGNLASSSTISLDFDLPEFASFAWRGSDSTRSSGTAGAGKIGDTMGVKVNTVDPPQNDVFGLPFGRNTFDFFTGGVSAGASPNTGNPADEASFASYTWAVHWSIFDPVREPVYPGQTFENYAKGNTGYDRPSDNEDDEPPPASDAANVAGVNLTMPIIGDLGHTGKFFAGIPTQVEAGPLTGAQVTGYTVTSEYEPLTSFIIPTLPGGAENLSITFNEQTLPLVAGQEIDFGPGGAQEFAISGIDPTAPGFTPGDLVMGLQFAAEGLASLIAIPTLYIPPGDYNENGLVDAADYTVWRDGLGGAHAPEGYDLWRSKFGPPGGSGGEGQAVPEPQAALLLVMAGLALIAVEWLGSKPAGAAPSEP
ncbi:MAG: hypothetical protein WD851_20015 [Pirellulales bacterium]